MIKSRGRTSQMNRFAQAALAILCLISPFQAAFAATEDAKLTGSDVAPGDLLGSSVSVSGDIAVIGSYGDDIVTGSAYVFVRSGATWTEQAKLTASDGAVNDYFGISVSVSGETVVVGAPGDDSLMGAAYVFTRSGATWTEQAKLIAPDAAPGDKFGQAVAISGDSAVITSYRDDDGGFNSGSAYVFTRTGITWTLQEKLIATDAKAYSEFGGSVAVSGDTVVVGSYYDYDYNTNYRPVGSAYVFTRSGTSWSEQQKLSGSDPTGLFFGFSVSVSDDNVVVGAPHFSPSPGFAYAFRRSGATWTEEAKLTASDAAAGDNFGISVAVSGDTAIVGSYLDDAQAGSAYVFTRSSGTWTEEEKLTASDAAAGDSFGFSVAFSNATAVIGASGDQDAGSYSGSAYVFGLDADSDGDGVPDDLDCNPSSDLSPTVVIDGIDTGVPNILFDDGCTLSDDIAAIAAAAGSHGEFVAAVAKYLNELKKSGVITGKQKGAILSAVSKATIP